MTVETHAPLMTSEEFYNLPDDGIEKFTVLALESNKDTRILVQPIWLRWDVYEPTMKKPDKVDHNAITGEELRKRHAVYFKEILNEPSGAV